jgi:Spy/CpxP family protein refolding chaperone
MFVAMSALVVAGSRQTQTKPDPALVAAKPSQASIDEVLKTMRADMQSARADFMAKNLTLTAAQAAKFWPLFETYQKEQNVIMDAQLKGIQKYAESYNSLDDATAVSLITSHFGRDAQMNALRQRFFKEFQTVLPAKLAARVMQIDHRLSLVAQLEIATKIPLIH